MSASRSQPLTATAQGAATPAAEPSAAFRVELGVAVPGGSRPRPLGKIATALRDLGAATIGASLFFPEPIKVQAIQQAAYRHGGAGWIITRKMDGGIRAWKVSEPKVRA